MARITVEDCLDHVENRFQLVLLAAKRARQIMRGSADPTVPWDNDKATVVALREIATGHTDFSDAHEIDLIPTIPAATSQIIVIEEEDTNIELDLAPEPEPEQESEQDISEEDHHSEKSSSSSSEE